MEQCPRCENEQLKEEYNYCPICGSLLDHEIAEEALKILNTLLDKYKTYECRDDEEKQFRALIVGALSIAIKELERTSQEVAAQKSEELLNEETALRIAPLTRAIIGYATRKEISLDELEIAFKIAKENYILIHNNKNES